MFSHVDVENHAALLVCVGALEYMHAINKYSNFYRFNRSLSNRVEKKRPEQTATTRNVSPLSE